MVRKGELDYRQASILLEKCHPRLWRQITLVVAVVLQRAGDSSSEADSPSVLVPEGRTGLDVSVIRCRTALPCFT